MHKKLTSFVIASAVVFSNSALSAEKQASFVVLDTSKTIEDTKPKSKAKLEPIYDITNILTTPKEESEIYFNADSLENDANGHLVTATGNVEINRQDLTLRADKVTYDQTTEDIVAEGDVVILEKNGNVLFADRIDLTDKMQSADVENIKVILLDKTRLAAQSFHKKVNNRKVLRNAIYSPCDVCRDTSPLWQLKAKKVIHDANDQNIEYQSAFLEIKDVPVLYTPFFSHPDPSVKHRSGFLFPRIMSNGFLGAAIQPQYFWDINPQTNITFNPIISTEKEPVYSAVFNKYFYSGELNFSGTFLRDKEDKVKDNKDNRGNLFLYGRYDINDNWTADTDINYASDHNYLNDLTLPKKDDPWLTSRLRLQSFDNRDYAYVEGYYYDMLSYDLQHINKPYILPIMGYDFFSEPSTYGSYIHNSLSGASIYHKEDDSAQRLTMINSWNLPYTSPFGEKYKLTASLKSDAYYVKRYLNNHNEYYTGTTTRIFPQMGMEWRLPFISNTENTSQILEPIVVGAVAPNKGNKRDEIPNDDSRDFELTDTNIFDLDRYAGYDRNDVGSRVSYGLNWSFYGKKWGRSSVLLAQTYDFDKNLETYNANQKDEHFSDYVGRVYAAPNSYFDLTYRFKLDKDNYDLTYSELASSVGNDLLRLYTSYIYFPENSESSIYYGQQRKEIYTALSSHISRNWSVDAFNRHDIENKRTLANGAGISYEDECSRFSLQFEKEFSEDPAAENDLSFYFTFYLKTIGGIGNN